MRSLWILALIAVGLFLAPVTPAATVVVDLNGGADYIDIQSAIDAAADADTVLVKLGEYVITEPINFNRLHDPDDPASPPVKNIVVKSEGGAEVTKISMAETPANPDRASVVIFENGEGAGSVLKGFTLGGGCGKRMEPDAWRSGGGIFCDASSPSVGDCAIVGNSATAGGGLSCSGGSPTFADCTIVGNSALSGGGVSCSGGFPTFTNCTISGNSATGCEGVCTSAGGGVCCSGGPSTFTKCTISGNLAEGGGGVCFGSNASSTLADCLISGNSAINGGGVQCWGSSPTLNNCTISTNTARWAGGGVLCEGNSSPNLSNCMISGNSAGSYAGGVACFGGTSPILTNCTISGNAAAQGAGGVHCNEGTFASLTNCIVWGNAGRGVSTTFAGPTIIYSCIEGDSVWPGEGNIQDDPLFVRPGEWVECGSSDDPICVAHQWNPDTGDPTAWHRWIPGDFHLQFDSPCIDAGTYDGAPTTDIGGHGRPCGGYVDVGAYEFGDCPASAERFQRGDGNADGSVNITDGILTLNYLFLSGSSSPCADAADLDDGGGIDITDAIYLLNFLFLGGPAPAVPFDACGIDPTLDGLDCAAFAPCGAGG